MVDPYRGKATGLVGAVAPWLMLQDEEWRDQEQDKQSIDDGFSFKHDGLSFCVALRYCLA